MSQRLHRTGAPYVGTRKVGGNIRERINYISIESMSDIHTQVRIRHVQVSVIDRGTRAGRQTSGAYCRLS